MTLEEAIEIKQKYQYILQDASAPELIEADNISIEALFRIRYQRQKPTVPHRTLLPSETEE